MPFGGPHKKITYKQKLFAQKYIEKKGNGTQAALVAYDTDRVGAQSLASQNLKKPLVQEEIKRVMIKAGLSLEVVADKLKDATLAGIGVEAKNSDALRGIDMMLKLYGAYADKKSMQLSYSVKQEVAQKDMNEVRQILQTLSQRAQQLAGDND